jgi:hypothetical protein
MAQLNVFSLFSARFNYDEKHPALPAAYQPINFAGTNQTCQAV